MSKLTYNGNRAMKRSSENRSSCPVRFHRMAESNPPWPRSLEVLDLMSRGRSRAQAARELGIAEGTAKNHLNHLYARLNVSSAIECFRICLEYGYLEL